MKGRPARLRSLVLFWAGALLWLPAGVVILGAIRFGLPVTTVSEGWATMAAAAALSLVVAALCGLPLALACRRLGRLGHSRAAWGAGIVLGVATVAALLPAGLLGAPAIVIVAVMLSLPAWIAAIWLGRRARVRAAAEKPPLDGPDRRS